MVEFGLDQFLTLVVSGEHGYSMQTLIWVLPWQGTPKRVLSVAGVLRGFETGKGSIDGVLIDQETYNGVDGRTRGEQLQLWRWNGDRREFTLAGKVLNPGR